MFTDLYSKEFGKTVVSTVSVTMNSVKDADSEEISWGYNQKFTFLLNFKHLNLELFLALLLCKYNFSTKK